MTKITLTPLVNLENQTTAVNAINSNDAVIVTAFDNTLSRDGTAPNTMGAAIDMNGFQIYNLAAPSTVNSAVRLQDVATNPTIVVPGTGTSGHTVPFLDGVNTWSGVQTLPSPVITGHATIEGKTPTGGTGTGNLVLGTTPTLVTPILGTPTSGTLTNCTGLPLATGLSPALGTGVATFLATPSSSNLLTAVTDETGTGNLVFSNTPTLVTPVLGAATGTSVTVTGNIRSSGATSGIGYNTGSGGTVTQATNKTTNVTLNTMVGQIIMNNASLASSTTVSFTLNNSNITATDMVVLSISGGLASVGTHQAWTTTIGAGGCTINVRNISGGALTDAVQITFAVIKGAFS